MHKFLKFKCFTPFTRIIYNTPYTPTRNNIFFLNIMISAGIIIILYGGSPPNPYKSFIGALKNINIYKTINNL